MLYVAFSRATSANDLFIHSQYTAPTRENNNDQVKLEMMRLRGQTPLHLLLKFLEGYNKNIIFTCQNVRRLNKHFSLIKSDRTSMHCDMLT